MKRTEILKFFTNSATPAVDSQQFKALAAIKSVGTTLNRVQTLLNHDDGWRWPQLTAKELPGPMGTPPAAKAIWEAGGEPTNEQACKEYALSSFDTVPYAPFDVLIDRHIDLVVQPAIVHQQVWVPQAREGRYFGDDADPWPCRHCCSRYGIRLEHRRDSTSLWLRWDGKILPAPPDLRNMTTNMRAAEWILLALRNEIHRAGNELYSWSKLVCDCVGQFSGSATTDGRSCQGFLREHYHGLVIPAFLRLSGHIDRFNALRMALFKRLLKECFPGEGIKSYGEKAQAEAKLPNSQRSGRYWWKLRRIASPWAVIANLERPNKVIYRNESGRASIKHRPGKVGWLSQSSRDY